ncbi:hypothetical protein [Tomitella biformata]|uniref:hypothetical protein n=1 Tax=Tomitella biformata TaxID=630403 RepID=UPI0011DC8A33|nr:hypothetical protein [Tomitella biformata]
MTSQLAQVQPVCVAIGGRAGVGRSTLVDALAGRLAGLGPLTVGELPPSNDPTANDRVRAPDAYGRDVPIDIVVHMILRSPQDSDRAAIRMHRGRGIPVLGVLARADTTPECWAVAERCTELPLLPVGLDRNRGWLGLDELVDCLSAGIAEILAGRADRELAQLDRWALEGTERDRLERLLAGPDALRLRMTGAKNWADTTDTVEGALAAAARWRVLANTAPQPADAERARNWHRRHVARAVQLGAGQLGAGRGEGEVG